MSVKAMQKHAGIYTPGIKKDKKKKKKKGNLQVSN